MPVLLAPAAEPDGLRDRRAGRAGRPGVRLGGVRGGQRVRPGHRVRYIVALEAVATEATKPLVGVLPGLPRRRLTSGEPGPCRRPAQVRRARRRDPCPVRAVAYAHWRDRDPGAVPLLDVDETAAKRVVNRGAGRQPGGPRAHRGRDSGAAQRVRDRARAPVRGVHSLDEAIEVAERLGWNVVLKATAQAVRGRPDLASVLPQHRRSPRRWPRPGAIWAGWSPSSACRSTTTSAAARAGRPGDGAARRRAGDHQPGGRRVRADHLARAWTAFRASCSATPSIGCRR